MSGLENLGIGIGAAAYGVFRALNLIGWLPQRHKTSTDILSEIEIKDKQITRLENRVDELTARNVKLENATDLNPVVELIQQSSEIQSKILDRLVFHNGSFAHMEQSFKEVEESLKLLTGFILGITGATHTSVPLGK